MEAGDPWRPQTKQARESLIANEFTNVNTSFRLLSEFDEEGEKWDKNLGANKDKTS